MRVYCIILNQFWFETGSKKQTNKDTNKTLLLDGLSLPLNKPIWELPKSTRSVFSVPTHEQDPKIFQLLQILIVAASHLKTTSSLTSLIKQV